MHVLVIGGTGLIGKATVELLVREGMTITLVSRKRPSQLPAGATWQECDVVDAGRLREIACHAAPAAVLHLAALLQFACEQHPRTAMRVNVDGTLNVLEAARTAGVQRVVFGSSIAVYGQTDERVQEEGWAFRRTGIYGLTKLMGEELGARWQAEHGMRFVALRYAGIFGPEEEDGREQSPGMSLVRKNILRCALGEDVTVEGASGRERSHLTHVSDAAEATRLALVHPAPAHTVYNVAGPEENYVSLQQMHEAVRAIVPTAGAALWSGSGKSAGLVDTGRIRTDLGFEPKVTLHHGLRQTLAAQVQAAQARPGR